MRSPPYQHEHLMLAFLFGSHAHDLDFIAYFQWRDHTASDTAGRKWKLQGVGKIVIPFCRLLFRTIRIHNDFHMDALFTLFILSLASHIENLLHIAYSIIVLLPCL